MAGRAEARHTTGCLRRLICRARAGWSDGLFPAGPPGRPVEPPSLRRFPFALALLLIAGPLFLARLDCPLLEPEETRYAEIPRQMRVEGRIVEPVWHGEPYYHKPPLFYWLVMGCYAVFGVHDWAARLVPALAGIATVLVTYLWGRRVAGRWVGALGALVLCLSARFVYLGRMVNLDGLLCLWVVSALAAAHIAVTGERLRWRWWLLSAVACGLGLLTKGPVALVLVLVPVSLFQVLDRRAARPSLPALGTFAATALLVAAPWYVAVGLRSPEAARAFFWEHNVLRYVAPVDHARPAWFYLPPLLVGMLPWSALLVPLTRLLARRRPDEGTRRPPALGLFLLAALWGVLFFSLSGCKRPAYVLPVLPPLALALGCWLAGAMPWPAGALQEAERRRAQRFGLGAAALFALLLLAIHQLLPSYHRKFGLRVQVRAQGELAAVPGVAVRCYPRRWDSVSFYLERNDVAIYRRDRPAAMVADLASRPTTLVFVKAGAYLREFAAALPPTLEFLPRGRRGGFAVAGTVRRRAPAGGAAQRGRQPPGAAATGG